MRYIEATELKLKFDDGENVTILDIREPYEVEVASIGGVHIPMAEVSDKVGELEKHDLIVVMCRTGKRAEAVANMLIQDFGLTNVMVLQGGIESWADKIDNSIKIY